MFFYFYTKDIMRFYIDSRHYIETNEPLDISIPLSDDDKNPKAWYVDKPKFSPVIDSNFIGSVNLGGSVNFRNIEFNPHGHGTHTECLGHITQEIHSVNTSLKTFFFHCYLISLEPKRFYNSFFEAEDRIISREQFGSLTVNKPLEALVIRTLPNSDLKKSMDYSSKNPAYLDESCFELFDDLGIQHLLIDLPSVDREDDNGALRGHHAFWKVPNAPEMFKTITELIYVDNSIPDGEYILELQLAPFENDAAPSRPVLYRIQ